MDSIEQYTHPSLLLVNEVEILFTQVRLMELYVKQAQTAAANEAARVRERFQIELNALQKELKQKESVLEARQASSHQADQLRIEVQELRAQLLERQRLSEARKKELDAAALDAAALRERIAHLESTVQNAQTTTAIEFERTRAAFQAELADSKGQLERKESALQSLQTSSKEVEDKLLAEIEDLRTQLAAKAELLEKRTAELQNTRSETTGLRQRIQQLELANTQTAATANEATQIRETLQAELVALRAAFEQKELSLRQNHAATKELEEHLNAQLGDLQNQLAEKQGLLETRSQEIGELTAKTNVLQEQITCLELANQQTVKEAKAEARALEDSLRARLQELEATVSEKAQLLENRTTELQSTQSETALLRERIQQLELTRCPDRGGQERSRIAAPGPADRIS